MSYLFVGKILRNTNGTDKRSANYPDSAEVGNNLPRVRSLVKIVLVALLLDWT